MHRDVLCDDGHLGSTRLLTNAGGVFAWYDYEPFGQEIGAPFDGRTVPMGYASAPDEMDLKFTGQIRDSETMLDWFNVRYYPSWQGRFQGPDPGNAGADPSNPQSWNGYAYVANNPLSYTDPSGMFTESDGGGDNGVAGAIATGVVDLFEWLFGGGGPPPSIAPSLATPSSPIMGPTFSVTGWGTADSGSGIAPYIIPGLIFTAEATALLKRAGKAACRLVPEGSTLGVSGAIGIVGGQAGTLEVITNYNTGEVSGFASGGLQVGFNGGLSGNVMAGLIRNLPSNSSYSGPFTNGAASLGPFGGFVGLSSGGFSRPLNIDPHGAQVAGATLGKSGFGIASATASVTIYTKPRHLGNIWTTPSALGPAGMIANSALYGLRQLCN